MRLFHKGEALNRLHNLALPRLNQFVENRAYNNATKETVSKVIAESIAKNLDKILEWFKARPFTKDEITKARDTGIAEGNDVTTVWGMVQGITAYTR